MRAVDRFASSELQSECGLTRLVADTLVARGITTTPSAQQYLHPDIDRKWSNPESIFGLRAVADALKNAILDKKRLLIFGDFDVDGISATAIMVHGLRVLGADVDYLIPNRIDEGYGLTAGALARIVEKNPEVMITVDCGISAKNEVEQLMSCGIQVLVTDHHQPSDDIPQNIPVADPKLEADSESSILSGAGVALKLLALVGQELGRPGLWRDYVDLAALGTLADLMPLVNENRALVASGLTMIEKRPRPGIAAVLASTRNNAEPIRSITLSFTLIPRLNAAGRMGDPALALQLLLSDDHNHAQELAGELEQINENRRSIEADISKEAIKEAEMILHGQKILVIKGKNWHEGVKGIVAARLVAYFDMPVIVFTENNDDLRGSGRGNGTVNLFKAVEKCSDLVVRFGGHEAAVGVTIHKDRFEEFKSRLEQIFEVEPPEDLIKQLTLDLEVDLSQADMNSAKQLCLLEPYGKENEEPLYITQAVYLKNTRAVGANKNHLSCTVSDGRTTVQAICFNCPDIETMIAWDKPVDIIYNLRLDEWNGNVRAKLHIRHLNRHLSALQNSEREFICEEVIHAAPTREIDETHAGAASRNALLRRLWKERITDDPTSVPEMLASEILGDKTQLFDSQKKALDALMQGASVLSIMATGRGKSLIFQVHAAYLALSKNKASVFIYPLRALIADQSSFITGRFSKLGLKASPLTGENSTEEKDRIFQRLYENDLDVLLTTPEFFQLHDWRFLQSQRIGFIVFDEAHHIETELQTGRDSYHRLQSCRKTFHEAQFLAVTATSDDRITEGIREALSIDQVIIDETIRENLKLDDARNLQDRECYLASIVEKAHKTIIYVNSRAQAVSLVRFLRKHLSARTDSLAFYHAGLNRYERAAIEEGFRLGKLCTIISTSAFGEGINIPDVSDVVLFHLPFSIVAFNQMSGRAGRNGQKATIHVVFNEKDAAINREILAPIAPVRAELVVLYRALKVLIIEHGRNADVSTNVDQITAICRRIDPLCDFDEKKIKNSLAIFEELGLLDHEITDNYVLITLPNNVDRVELSASSRYLEGIEELALFEQFKQWVFQATSEELRLKIVCPLVPTDRKRDCCNG